MKYASLEHVRKLEKERNEYEDFKYAPLPEHLLSHEWDRRAYIRHLLEVMGPNYAALDASPF